jgi:hypothetical protein
VDSGVAIFPTDDSLSPAELGRLVEERGHRWLFFPEHTHIPAGWWSFARAEIEMRARSVSVGLWLRQQRPGEAGVDGHRPSA